MSPKKKDPSKGRSVAVRPESRAVPPPAAVVVPVYPVPVESPGAVPAEIEERRTQLSVDFNFIGLGRLKLAFARLFRREA